MKVSPRRRPGRVFPESGANSIVMETIFRVWKNWKMHHARILEASGSASWKKWAWTPGKHRVFCLSVHHARTTDAWSILWPQKHICFEKKVNFFWRQKSVFAKTLCFTVQDGQVVLKPQLFVYKTQGHKWTQRLQQQRAQSAPSWFCRGKMAG